MKRFVACAKKEFRHIARDQRTALILLVLPIVQIVLFGFALNTEVNELRLGICIGASSTLESRLIERLEGSGYFTVAAVVEAREEPQQLFRERKIDAALTVPSHFEEDLLSGASPALQVAIDASNPNVGRIGVGYVEQVLASLLVDQMGSSMASLSAPPIRLLPEMLYNPTLKSTYNFVPGIMGLVLIIICCVMTSVSIVREREYGTIEVLLVSPLRPRTLLRAKLLPYIVISYINLLSILLLSYFVLGVPIHGSLWLLWLVSTVYILLALSLGLLISAIAREQSTAIMIAGIGMMMPTLMLSGMLFPISGMPRLLQYLAEAVPAKWYIDAVRCIMIQGGSIGEVWRELSVLLGMTILVASVALAAQRKRL